MKKRTILKYTTLIGALCAVFAIQQAKADTLYSLTVPNSAVSGYPGPYGFVDVHLVDPNTATITFTANSVGGYYYLFSGAQAVDVNVNAGAWTLSNITASNSGSGFDTLSSDYSDGGSNNADGFGLFNQTIDGFDGYKHSATTISFTLDNTSGTWASSAVVLTANDDGYLAAGHIFVTGSPDFTENGVLTTGFVANGPPVSTPDSGMTAALLGLALSGLAGLRARFGRNRLIRDKLIDKVRGGQNDRRAFFCNIG